MEAIYYDWSTSSWGTRPGLRRTERMAAPTPAPGTPVLRTPARAGRGPSERSAQSKRTPTFVILAYHLKNAHKWHEGIPPARRNYLGLSISVSCTIRIVSRSLPFVCVSLSLSHLVSFMIANFNGWDVSVIPQVYSRMGAGEALSRRVAAVISFVFSFNIVFVWYNKCCYFILRPVVVQGHKRVTVNATGCEFDSHSEQCKINFYFLVIRGRKINDAKRHVEFRHSTHDSS